MPVFIHHSETLRPLPKVITRWGADRFTDNESTSTNTLYTGPNLRQRPIEDLYDVKDYLTGKGDE